MLQVICVSELFYMSFHQVRMMLVKSSPLLCFLAIFAISCCSMFAKQLLLFLPNLPSPLISSPLFCRWWNCPSPYIIWNMSWWSRTCEKLGIITSCPANLLCTPLLLLLSSTPLYSSPLLSSFCFFCYFYYFPTTTVYYFYFCLLSTTCTSVN